MIIHDPITGQRIQTILALGDRACLFLQPIPLQSIYLSSYDTLNKDGSGHPFFHWRSFRGHPRSRLCRKAHLPDQQSGKNPDTHEPGGKNKSISKGTRRGLPLDP